MAFPNAKAPLGQGGRFAALAAKIGPAAAASAGRRKYGAKKMAELSRKGRRAAKKGSGGAGLKAALRG